MIPVESRKIFKKVLDLVASQPYNVCMNGGLEYARIK